MAICDNLIRTIESTECLTDSLAKINSNFTNLQTTFCTLKERVDKQVQVRTFFYYGPNADTTPASGMADEQTAKPSPETIFNFVNGRSQLNLPSISNINDVAYIIYQKTGFQYSLSATYPDIPVTANYSWGEIPSAQELLYSFRPTLIIWRLAFDGTQYNISTGFPKYHAEMTNNNPSLWDKPNDWTQFTSL